MLRPLVALLSLLFALHAPLAAAFAASMAGGDAAALEHVERCPECIAPAAPAGGGDCDCPVNGLSGANCITACAGMAGLPVHPGIAVGHAADAHHVEAACERIPSLVRRCPTPPPRALL